ncbi:MAG TPA: FecR domain-containing protein [Polyangia bacterium]|jgi:TolA-binding protein|nr:FecR domain-containing protein [Polyangia bacterium]
MTRDKVEVRDLLAPMAEHDVDLDGAGFRVDRARVLARMAAASQPARRRWVGGATIAMVAAGVGALALGGWLWQRHAGPARPGVEVTVVAGSATQIAATNELLTAADSQARVRTAEGLQIELRSQTRVALGELERSASQVKLLDGSIRCSIPHRAAARPFQVVAAGVTVVDLGTVFTVSLDGLTHETRVTVEEGEVLVQHASGPTRVRAPQSWSSTEDARPAPIAPAAPLVTPPAPRATALVKARPPATLEQEAQLLRRGLAAERQGRSAEAAAALSQLLQRYPRSPLAPDARDALARVTAGTPR